MMFAIRRSPLLKGFGHGTQVLWNPATPLPIVRGAATSTVPATGRSASRTFLGTTAGTAIFIFSGSLLAWPVADLCLGPKLVLCGMRADPAQTADLLDSPVASAVSQETSSAQDP